MKRIICSTLIILLLLSGCSNNIPVSNIGNEITNNESNNEQSMKEAELDSNSEDETTNNMIINQHRTSEEDLIKLLQPYINLYNRSTGYEDIYDFRIELTYMRIYAEKLVIPDHPNKNSDYSKELIKKITDNDYSIKYIYAPSMKWYDNSFINISSDGSFKTFVTETYDYEIITPVDSGNIDTVQLKEALIQAVSIGFFELPSRYDVKGGTDGSIETFIISIGNQLFEIGGSRRDLEDDVFYKVKGTLLKIINSETDMKQ